jgi:preprotein translocase subunit Sec63
MNIDKAVLAFAGFVVLLGLALGYYVNTYWYLLTAFAGVNMLQASVTGFCPAAMAFKKLGLRDGCAFN